MQFQSFTAHGDHGTEVIAVLAVDVHSRRVWEFQPVTHLWHPATGMWATVVTPDLSAPRTLEVTPMDAKEVATALAQVPTVDRRRHRMHAQEVVEQAREGSAVFTTAEMGLSTQDLGAYRPLTAPGLADLVVARGHEWTTLARYSPGTGSDTLRMARKRAQKARRFPGAVQARLEPGEAGETLLQVRMAPTLQGAPVQEPGAKTSMPNSERISAA